MATTPQSGGDGPTVAGGARLDTEDPGIQDPGIQDPGRIVDLPREGHAADPLDLASAAIAPVLLGFTDEHGDWAWANERLTDWIGAPPRGRWWTDAHPDDRAGCERRYRGALRERVGFEIEYRRQRADGGYGWLLERAEPRQEAGGFVHAGIDITARRDAEAATEAATARAERLQRITASLSRAATADEVFEVVLSELVEAVGGDGAATALLNDDGTALRVRGSVGYPPRVVDELREFGLDAPLPMALAVRRRRRVFYPSNAEMFTDNPGMDAIVRPTRDRAVVALPLVVADEVIGSVGLSWARPRQLADEDLSFLDAVAGQLAQAYDRARLFQAEARARRFAEHTVQQLAFLAEASRTVAASLDADETLTRLTGTLVPWLADWCAIHVLDGLGNPRHVATAHADADRVAFIEDLHRRWPVRLDDPLGTGRTLRTGETQVIERISDQQLQVVARDDEHLALLRGLGLHSALTVPLRAHNRVVGAITAANEAGRSFAPGDVMLVEEVAARAAIAVVNAQAYAERSAVAAGLQASLLPATLSQIPGMELASRYLAAGEGVDVGGDFYDAFPGIGGRWMVAIGDVRGKGVEAASVTGLARATIRCAALHSRSPRRVLADLNTMLARGEAEEADSPVAVPRFCTVCLTALKPVAGAVRATVCTAGHPLPLLLRRDGSVSEVGESGSLLGVFDRPDLPERTVWMETGDTLVYFTDGITDRHTGGQFFEDELEGVLSPLAGRSADAIAERLQQAARDFARTPPADDMAIIVVRHRGNR